MLYLNANEEKRMVFEVDIHGVDTKELQGFIRFNMYGMEVGFPAEIEHKKITALVPPLIEMVDKDIEDGTIIEAKLELFTDRHYFKPWEGEIKVGAPMGIKAQLSGESDNTPRVTTRLVSRESKERASVKEDKAVTKDDIQSMILDTLRQLTSKKPVINEAQVPKPQKKKESSKNWTKDKLMNISEEEIVSYIERKGSKNKLVQEVILNEARAKAGSNENYKIFREVVRALKRPKGDD